MKKGLKKAKAKVGRLLSHSRPGSWSQTPGLPDPDPGPVQSVSLSSDIRPELDQQPSQLTMSVTKASTQLAQIAVTEAPTDLDHDLVLPALSFKPEVPQSGSEASVSGTVQMLRLASHGSVGHGAVCMTCAVALRRAYSLKIVINNNQNTTYNYGGQVLNYNPIINTIYLTEKEV